MTNLDDQAIMYVIDSFCLYVTEWKVQGPLFCLTVIICCFLPLLYCAFVRLTDWATLT